MNDSSQESGYLEDICPELFEPYERNEQWEVIRDKMLSALIRYDKMAEKRSQWWNKYAMAHYCRALQDMDENILQGDTIQDALNKSFIHSPPTCQPYKSLKRVLDSF